MKESIRNEVDLITPFDSLEAKDKAWVLAWIDSGAELCRLEKPATPRERLVS